MDRPTSFSQCTLFENCARTWFYKYVRKIPIPEQDYCYANGGTTVHKCLQKFYDDKTTSIEDLKKLFEQQWREFKLDDTKIKYKKDEYWLMVLNGIALDLNITTTEQKMFWLDAVGYLDGIDTQNDEITDWKSSTRRKENEEEYKKQLMLYGWFYYRKFQRMPKKLTVYYLKYSGSKSELSFFPTFEDLKEIKRWFEGIRLKMGFLKRHPDSVPPFNEDYMWCPYKNLIEAEKGTFLDFTILVYGNHVKLDGPMSKMLHTQLERKFSYELKAAYFMKKANPHANTTVKFWNLQNRMIPIGFVGSLSFTLHQYIEHTKIPGNVTIVDKREFNNDTIDMPDKFINGKVLRDYQNKAVEEFLKNPISILEVGTGGGKTEIAIELIRRLKYRTLFIVDKIELLKQTKKRIEEALGIKVGQIGSGVQDYNHITVATIQTLIKNIGQFSQYLETVRFAIFDETHKVAAKSYVTVGNHLTGTEYRLGISGTAFRDDGNDMMITSVVGNKCFDLSSKVLIDKGWLMKPTIIFIGKFLDKQQVVEKEIKCKQGLINETPNYLPLYNEFIVCCTTRNNLIKRLVDNNKDKQKLILVKLIEHGEMLEKMIEGSKYLHGSTPKKEREEIFEKFVKGELKVLISTISIFAEGIDIPSLDIVINASANKGEVKSIQVLGRILRKLKGKENAHYYDFMDETQFFRMASLARKNAFRKEGHDIEIVESQHI